MARHIELYYLPASYYSQRIRMYLSEKGVTPKLHLIDLQKGQHLSPEFLRINPAGQVPVLKTMDATVADSHEIYKYGEENIPGDTLVPSDIADEVWGLHDRINALNMGLITFGCLNHPNLSECVNLKPEAKKTMQNLMQRNKKAIENKMVAAAADQVPLLAAKAKSIGETVEQLKDKRQVEEIVDETGDVFAQCERQLEKSSGPFLFGSTLTIADIDLTVLVLRMELLGLQDRLYPQGRCPKIHDFIAAIEKRRSYKLIHKDAMTFGALPSSLYPLIGGAFVVLGIAIGIGLFIYFKRRN